MSTARSRSAAIGNPNPSPRKNTPRLISPWRRWRGGRSKAARTPMRILLIGGNGTNCKIRDPDEHAVTSPPPESVRLRSGLRTFSYSYQENSALAIRVGREEPGHLVVVESKAGRAQALGRTPPDTSCLPECRLPDAPRDIRGFLGFARSSAGPPRRKQPPRRQQGAPALAQGNQAWGRKFPCFRRSSRPRSR